MTHFPVVITLKTGQDRTDHTFDSHIKNPFDCPQVVADITDVLASVLKTCGSDSENTAVGGRENRWWDYPSVRGAGVSHSHAVQL